MCSLLQLLAQADLQMLDNSDVDATYEQLQPITVASQAALVEASSLRAGTSSTPTPALVLQRLQGWFVPALATLACTCLAGWHVGNRLTYERLCLVRCMQCQLANCKMVLTHQHACARPSTAPPPVPGPRCVHHLHNVTA